MGRLIDADALIEKMRTIKTLYGTPITERDKQMIHWIIGHINEQPNAYDVEKVVAELHNFSLNTEPYCNEMTREGICTEFTDCDYCKLQKAIDIVKKGGVY